MDVVVRSALTILGISSESQNSGQVNATPQSEDMGKPDQTHSGHALSGDTSKSDKEVVAEKSKQSSDAS